MFDEQPQLYPSLCYPPGFPRPLAHIEKHVMALWWLPLVLGPILFYWSVILCFVPFILLWIIPALLFGRKREARHANKFVEQQLSARAEIPDDIWGETCQADIARTVREQVVAAIAWEHPRFIPQDPFGIMICWQSGDICELDAIWRIQKAFGYASRDKSFLGLTYEELSKLTFGEVVDRILVTPPNKHP